VRRRDARGLLDLRRRGLGMAEGDVGRDGVGEEKALLENQADVAAQVVEVELAHVDAVEQHAAGGRVEEARDQAHQHALARAGRAEDGHALAGFHVEVDVAHDGLGAVVGEGDVFERTAPSSRGAAEGVGRALHLDRARRGSRTRGARR
jgi:hypothetical protein